MKEESEINYFDQDFEIIIFVKYFCNFLHI